VAGKGAWILNMLRGMMGESKFQQLTHQYVHDYSGKTGSTGRVPGNSPEKYHEKELGWFFAEWIDTSGCRRLRWIMFVFKTPNGFRVSGTVKQDRDLFRMPVEVAVISGDKQDITTVDLNSKSTAFDVQSFSMPDRVVPGSQLQTIDGF